MADSKDTDEVEITEESVSDETEGVEEETVEDSDEESEEESEDSEESEDEDDDESDESEEVPFKKRFTQFKGETPEEYLTELEEAYANSQAEYERLRLGKKDEEEESETSDETQDNPGYDLWAQQTEKEYKEFSDENEWFRTDENARKDVIENYLPVVAAVFKKKKGYNISMKEGLERAARAAGYSERKDVSIKKHSTPRANSKRPKAEAPTGISKKQIAFAKKMDPTLRDKSDSEVAKELAQALK